MRFDGYNQSLSEKFDLFVDLALLYHPVKNFFGRKYVKCVKIYLP